jgi:predicted nucleic acid-binding protein
VPAKRFKGEWTTIVENDVIFAYLNRNDKNHQIAKQVFEAIKNAKLNVSLSSISLVEMELIYRSENREDILLEHLSALASLPNVDYIPFTPEEALTSVYLRKEIGLSFFDSHYAAAALNLDGKIISFDAHYDNVDGLNRIDPARVARG